MGIFSRFPYTDFHRLNADWILEKIKEMMGITQQAAETVEGYDDRLTATETAAAGAVRFDRVQDLTALQQGQARDNIQAAPADMFGAVRYDQVQLLEAPQKARARSNIGAAEAGVVPSGAVRYDAAQELTTLQQGQARDNIQAAPADMFGAVRYDQVQLLDDPQKIRARSNIGAAAAADVPAAAVLYTSQSLTDEQKAQARTNIGASTGASGAVLYDQAQSLTSTQKSQALDNIGAAPTSAPVFTSSIEISSQATSTIAADQIMIYPSTLQSDTVSKLMLSGDVSPVGRGVILQGLEDPVAGMDAANKQFVIASLLREVSVAGTTPSISLSQAIDGSAYETLFACTGTPSSVTISTAVNSNYLATIVFTTGSTAPTFDTPLTIIGLDDLIPEANMIYEISIRSNRAVWKAWEAWEAPA